MHRAWPATMTAVTFFWLAVTLVADEQHQDNAVEQGHRWGSDHVARGFPDYVTGDECLFCHREIGKTWSTNRHQLTLRQAAEVDRAIVALRADPDGKHVADQTDFLLGTSRGVRFLKRSEQYGTLELSSVVLVPSNDSDKRGQVLTRTVPAQWDQKKFGVRCAGCHATAVDTDTRAFSATSIDCFACHGSVDLAHTKETRHVLLSDQNREPREVVSICGQCHLRGGVSTTSRLPYPNTFVAGDNLFRDFAVDLSKAAIAELPPTDRHIFENVRDVEMNKKTDTTCLSCHSIHSQNTERHQGIASSERCATCHVAGAHHSELNKAFLDARARPGSRVCEY